METFDACVIFWIFNIIKTKDKYLAFFLKKKYQKERKIVWHGFNLKLSQTQV